MAAGWPGLAVEEGNLTVQIAGLRKLLGTGPQGQDWIVTVPRIGYRLIQSQTPEPETASRPTLAVLPFQNLSGEAEADYFADGIVADIITALSRFRSLAVVSRIRQGQPAKYPERIGSVLDGLRLAGLPEG